MGELFAVVSGKGGTGKTSLCAALATALAKEGKRVLCIDCDVGLRNLDISLGLSECGALSFWDVSEGGYSLEDAFRHPVYPTLAFLTAPMNCPVEKIDTAAFGEMLSRARQMFDYVFLDAPAGVGAVFDAPRVRAEIICDGFHIHPAVLPADGAVRRPFSSGHGGRPRRRAGRFPGGRPAGADGQEKHPPHR